MSGALTPEGTPTLLLNIAGQDWVAVIDTGFDGDLELPDVLAQHFPGVSLGPQKAILAGGVIVTDEIFLIDFPSRLTARPSQLRRPSRQSQKS
jgi:hypothetical protein